MANTRHEHWATVKSVFKYLWGTYEYSIFYHSGVSGDPHLIHIHGYVDSNWVGDVNRRRSTSGYMFQLFGGSIRWMNKWQVVVTFSIA